MPIDNPYNRTGKVNYDLETDTYSFPLPNDPEYHIEGSNLRGDAGVVLGYVASLRNKNCSDAQIVDLLINAWAQLG